MATPSRLSKPGSKARRYQDMCLDILLEKRAAGAIPTSLRFVFYELEGRGLVPKAFYDENGKEKGRGPSTEISEAITTLRRDPNVVVEWSWIVDETRTLDAWRYSDSVASFVREVVPIARIDLWNGEPPPLILCEDRATSGILRSIAEDYLCPIAATNGQAGGFLMTDLVPLVAASSGVQRVLYLGDFDYSGGLIEENNFNVLSDYSELDWTRILLTADQVEEYDFPVIRKLDNRFKPPRWFEGVELQAFGQVEIQDLLTETLDSMVSVPLDEALAEEERQRVTVREVLDNL